MNRRGPTIIKAVATVGGQNKLNQTGIRESDSVFELGGRRAPLVLEAETPAENTTT